MDEALKRQAEDENATTPERKGMRRRWEGALSSVTNGLFHPAVGFIALSGLILGAFVLPPEGAGPPTCSMLTTTGIPCPSCGLTRSVTSIFHGHFHAAWQYNPFGYGVAFAFVLLSPLAFLPGKWRTTLKQKARRWDVVITMIILVFLAGMLVYGMFRAAMVQMGEPGYQWWRNDYAPPAMVKEMNREERVISAGPPHQHAANNHSETNDSQ